MKVIGNLFFIFLCEEQMQNEVKVKQFMQSSDWNTLH